jgi:hypothetical protein
MNERENRMSRVRRIAVRAATLSTLGAVLVGGALTQPAQAASTYVNTSTSSSSTVTPKAASWIAGYFPNESWCKSVGADGKKNGVWHEWVCYSVLIDVYPFDKYEWVLRVEKFY